MYGLMAKSSVTPLNILGLFRNIQEKLENGWIHTFKFISNQFHKSYQNFHLKPHTFCKNKQTLIFYRRTWNFKKWNLNIPGPSKDSETANVSEDPNFKTPKPKCRKFIFKPFIRTPNGLEHDESKEPVDVIIPEQLAASYGLYLWPSAPVLGEFM